jgi:hypothetical protein
MPTYIYIYIYTNLKIYPIHQILDTRETTKKDRYHIQKKKKNTYINGHVYKMDARKKNISIQQNKHHSI